MKRWRRVALYLIRNKRKTILLLVILTVLSALILLCVSVGNAADASLRELRRRMGGYFKIETDYTQGKFGRIDETLVKKVKDIGGIKAVNSIDVRYFMTEDLELMPGRFLAEGDPKANLARFLGNTDSSLNEYFMLEYYSLAEGRHIAKNDVGKALISDVLAEQNQLLVGDMFCVKLDTENLPIEQKGAATSHTLEVAGIYHINTPQGYRGSDAAECDIEENFIFTDMAFIRNMYGEVSGTQTNMYGNVASFFVENPKDMEKILARLLELDDYDWNEYIITKNNKTYEDSAAPLERLSGLVSLMVLVITVVGAAMLSLILFLWMRERAHEIGIYLSIGIRKSEIVKQRILENLAVAISAFLLAWGITVAMAGFAGRELIASFVEDSETEASFVQETDHSLKIGVGSVELAEIASLEILLILLSSGISSIQILKMQPKDILSEMS